MSNVRRTTLLDSPVIMQDIANAPINKGDFVVFVDGNQAELAVQIEKVHTEDDKGNGNIFRSFTTKVFKATNEGLEGTPFKFEINRAKTVYGAIIKAADLGRKFNDYQVRTIVAEQVRIFLEQQPGRKMQYDEAFDYVKKMRLLPESLKTIKEQKAFISQAFKENKHLIKSKGSWVRVGDIGIIQDSGFTTGSRFTVEIDFGMLCSGLLMVLNSLSCVKIKNTDG